MHSASAVTKGKARAQSEHCPNYMKAITAVSGSSPRSWEHSPRRLLIWFLTTRQSGMTLSQLPRPTLDLIRLTLRQADIFISPLRPSLAHAPSPPKNLLTSLHHQPRWLQPSVSCQDDYTSLLPGLPAMLHAALRPDSTWSFSA